MDMESTFKNSVDWIKALGIVLGILVLFPIVVATLAVAGVTK